MLIVRSGMDTHELVQRIRRSSVIDSTLDALNLTVEQLCCDYGLGEPNDLIVTSREWLSQLTRLLDERLTLVQDPRGRQSFSLTYSYVLLNNSPVTRSPKLFRAARSSLRTFLSPASLSVHPV